MLKARITVTLRPSILDPQGKAIQSALKGLGFDGVGEIRQGKVFDVALDTTDRAAAESRLKDMCERLLANPVVEDYRIELA